MIPVLVSSIQPRTGGRLTTAQLGVSGFQSGVGAAPGSITDNGTDTATITITVRDVDGNPLAGVTVVLSKTGPGTLTQPAATTNASGITTGSLVSSVAGTAVVTAVANGVTLGTTASVVVTAGAGTTYAIGGTVRKSGVAVANAGIVEFVSGGSVVATAVVDGSGVYASDVLQNISYGVRLQPSYLYSLGSAETGAQDPTAYDSVVAADPAATKDFVVIDAQFYEIFDYASSAALRSTLFTSAAFPPGTWDQAGGFSTPSRINHLATGGPTGGDAMEYDFPAKPNPAPGCASYFLAAKGRPNGGNGGPASSERWIVWEDFYDDDWSNGNDDCSNSYEYKVLLFHIGSSGKNVELLLYGGTPASRNMKFTFTVVGNAGGSTSNALQGGQYSVGANTSTFFGTYHQLAIQMVRFDGSSTNWECHLWIDGVKRLTLLGTGASTPFTCPNGFTMIEPGANMNTGGPTVAQKRKISRIGVYSTRPSMRAEWAA